MKKHISDISETERRIHNSIQFGVISEVDHATGLCRASLGGRVTPPVPWIIPRAGDDIQYDHPDIGEQCIYLSPFGDATDGAVIVGILSDAIPTPPEYGKDKTGRKYSDGSWVRYDREKHLDEANYPDKTHIEYNAGKSELTIQHCSGAVVKITATGSIVLHSPAEIRMTAKGRINLIAKDGVRSNNAPCTCGRAPCLPL